MSLAVSQSASRTGPTAQELAQAIRLGLEHRRWPFAPVEPPVPEPPAGVEVMARLWPTYNALQRPADAKPGRFQRPMRFARRVLKVLLRPWLDVQTQFNHSVIEALDAQQRQFVEHLQQLAAYLRERPAALQALANRLDETHFEIARCRDEAAGLGEQVRDLGTELATLREQVGQAVRAFEQAATAVEERHTDRLAAAMVELRRELGHRSREAEARYHESQEKLHDTEVRLTELQNELPVLRDEAVNRELGWQGEIAQAGLWFNPPVRVQILDRKPQVAGVSERILEHIFVHTRLPAPPARVLDLGCAESTCSIELASLGFQVVGVDLRRLPLEHPNFQMVKANLAELPFPDGSFDVVISLSTIEHVGLGWYAEGEDRATDERAAAEAWRVLRPGGRFILTVPYGRAAETPLQRVYDAARLDHLLAKFRRVETAFGLREGESWAYSTDAARAGAVDSSERVGAVALAVVEK